MMAGNMEEQYDLQFNKTLHLDILMTFSQFYIFMFYDPSS